MGELGIAIITALSSLLASQEATLLFVGDAMMHQRQIDVAKQSDGTYDYSECFAQVAPLISSADYAVVNLETPLNGAPYSGYPMFNTPDSYATALKDAGFDLFLTANNHTLDRRDRGLKRTVDVLNGIGVDHIGTYRNIAARDSVLPFVKNVNGFNIGFLNYTYGTNGIDIQSDVVVDYINKSKISNDIKRARQAGAELVCVTIHWGEEYKLLPNSTQRALADYIFSEGADMIIGGHPHVIQPIEMRTDADGNNRLLVYSLGNFISNMTTRDTRGGAIVRAHLCRDANGKARIDSADYDLVFTLPGKVGGENFKLVYADSCNSGPMADHAKAFRNSATSIYIHHNVNVGHR